MIIMILSVQKKKYLCFVGDFRCVPYKMVMLYDDHCIGSIFTTRSDKKIDRYMIAMAHLSAQNETSILIIVSEGFQAKPRGFTGISDSNLCFLTFLYMPAMLL